MISNAGVRVRGFGSTIVLLTRTSYSPFFFFNDTATTEIYTLSLHDALPICFSVKLDLRAERDHTDDRRHAARPQHRETDRKSTRPNSSHVKISYAVFCLKKKKKKHNTPPTNKKKKNKTTHK